jgi:hypothetical protein
MFIEFLNSLLAVVLISASNVFRVHNDLGLIYFQEIQPLKSVESAHTQIFHYDLSIRSHILASDEIEMKKHREMADIHSAQMIIELQSIRKIHTSDEEQKLLQDFDRSWAEYLASTQKAMDLSEQGGKSKATALLETTHAVFSEIESNLSALANYNELESQKFYEDEAASRQPVEWSIAILIGIIAAGGLGAFTMMHDAVEREALVASNRMYQMLSQANQILAQSQEEGTLLNDICQIIHEIGGYKMVWVGYVDPLATQGVKPSAQIGFPKEYVWVCLDCEECNSPAMRAIRLGKPVVSPIAL